MKTVVRAFFKTLRVILGPFMLLGEFVTRPKAMSRPAASQAEVEQQCASIVLYQYKTCPFCIKVRQEMRRLSLKITQVDAQPEGPARAELTQQGGHTKVPCSQITAHAGHTQRRTQAPGNPVRWVSTVNRYVTPRFFGFSNSLACEHRAR